MRQRFARLPTGLKMFLIFILALSPLGLGAIALSVDNARERIEARQLQDAAWLETIAALLDAAFVRQASALRAAQYTLALVDADPASCRQVLAQLSARAPGVELVLPSRGGVACAMDGVTLPPPVPGTAVRRRLAIVDDAIVMLLSDDQGRPIAVARYPRLVLTDLIRGSLPRRPADLQLVQAGRAITLQRRERQSQPLSRPQITSASVADGALRLRLTTSATPVRAIEAILILLPVLLWLAAAIIGWAIVSRLVLRPLEQVQRAVAAYQPGDRAVDLPPVTSPVREIGALASAFESATRTVARHEAELEAAVERQKKLVREVHHRVKNNLQVVASLLNLHARGVANEEVAAAYASIQRRVDALAVVHRNHYAELEDNRGVSLRSLVSELGANLRATAPDSAAAMAIRIDIAPFHVTQDVAVSVAFLITEMVEYAMLCGGASVNITLTPVRDKTALLAVESDRLTGEATCEPALTDRFERIVTGLSRQLRSSLERDREAGRYSLELAVLGPSD